MKNKKLIITVLVVILLVSTSFYTYHNLSDDVRVKLSIFNSILNEIKNNYVEERNLSELLDVAIENMLKELDPHTIYMLPRRGEEMRDQYQGYAGIGILFGVINEKVTATNVYKNGPAYEAGMEIGDRIVQIGEENVIGMPSAEIVRRLKGHPGSPVTVEVEREGVDSLVEMTIKRRKLYPESIPAYFMFEEGIGYIKIERFTFSTAMEFDHAIRYLESQGMNKLILDLRNNGGGFLQAAYDVASFFLPKGKMIVYTKGRTRSSNREYRVPSHSRHLKIPLILMMNENSASGSEIIAGAIQDWDRGLIVGRISFGKGLVQTPKDYEDGSRLLITTAFYYTPVGRLIQRDFKDKSITEYYMEGRVDSLKKKLSNNNREKFITPGGRTVYGGGGINPDVEFEWVHPDTLNRFYRSIGINEFFFCDYYAGHNRELGENLENYIETFEVDNQVVDAMRNYLNEKEFEFTEDDLNGAMHIIKRRLKERIAYQFWGDQGRIRVELSLDDEFHRTLGLFDQAVAVQAMGKF